MENELLNYYIKSTNERLTKIDKKIDQLIQFKWQIIGGSVVVSAITTVILTFAIQLYIKNGG